MTNAIRRLSKLGISTEEKEDQRDRLRGSVRQLGTNCGLSWSGITKSGFYFRCD